MDINAFLKLMVDKGASDLLFSVGTPPSLKIEGVISSIGEEPLTSKEIASLLSTLANERQKKEFETTMELNMAYSIPNVGRFRVNVFRQRGEVGIVIRYIKGEIPTIEELNLPPILKSFIMELRGLILVVGSTGSGKSTTLASMIDYRNENHPGHILTIEDPIEYLYKHKQSIVNQREVGSDTLDYESALKNAMREAPDVILIGEIRDRETMKHAIAYAETGHLCISTLHSNNANQTLERIVNFFSEAAKKQILIDIALNLRAIISLRLIPGVNDLRIAAVELLINTPYVSDLIEKGKIDDIKQVMERNKEQGMQTFDQALLELYESGKISKENAIKYADSKNNVAVKIRLKEDTSFESGTEDLKINPE